MPEGSEFVGQSIRNMQGEERDLNVLTLYRDGKAIPNPKIDRILEAEDKVLCFGKLDTMRRMIPAKTRRKRRPKLQDLPPEVTEPEVTEGGDEK
ncbi:MAG: TrkA C-terminal domain-containing protein [Halieaceae bacterium]|nr:TrkA C-terminal domain-containing protein [Halieaceae bacterium]